jgi:hypothetical protein
VVLVGRRPGAAPARGRRRGHRRPGRRPRVGTTSAAAGHRPRPPRAAARGRAGRRRGGPVGRRRGAAPADRGTGRRSAGHGLLRARHRRPGRHAGHAVDLRCRARDATTTAGAGRGRVAGCGCRSPTLDRGDAVRAVLDCTGGWYAAQDWRGVRLDRLLAEHLGADLPPTAASTSSR